MNKKILAIIFSAVLASLNAVGQNAYTLQQLRDSALAGNYSIKSARYSDHIVVAITDFDTVIYRKRLYGDFFLVHSRLMSFRQRY